MPHSADFCCRQSRSSTPPPCPKTTMFYWSHGHPLPDTSLLRSLRVRVEHLNMNCRVVACTRHGLPGLVGIFRFQVVHELHRGGVGGQLQRPLAAGLQLKGDVDGPVDGQAQAVNADLPVTPTFQQLLTACQLSPEVSLHVDVDVVPSLWEFPGEALPQGVLHWVHLDSRRGGVSVHWACLDRGHSWAAWLGHVSQ
ncbi:hypothetical protein EPR50_G00198860 [Perca flavescens]|uniref:Uncharacterized protein n=1 Tax=Perca flavescens TaxID=8167 RepID=A0A484CDI4_PERFV|nr:hypothetical protein EPR50_G00198860 [Perca flavescens]